MGTQEGQLPGVKFLVDDCFPCKDVRGTEKGDWGPRKGRPVSLADDPKRHQRRCEVMNFEVVNFEVVTMKLNPNIYMPCEWCIDQNGKPISVEEALTWKGYVEDKKSKVYQYERTHYRERDGTGECTKEFKKMMTKFYEDLEREAAAAGVASRRQIDQNIADTMEELQLGRNRGNTDDRRPRRVQQLGGSSRDSSQTGR